MADPTEEPQHIEEIVASAHEMMKASAYLLAEKSSLCGCSLLQSHSSFVAPVALSQQLSDVCLLRCYCSLHAVQPDCGLGLLLRQRIGRVLAALHARADCDNICSEGAEGLALRGMLCLQCLNSSLQVLHIQRQS